MAQRHSDSLTETLSNLIAQQPFFAVYLYNQMEISENPHIKTARTDGHTIEVNPVWYAKKTIGERVFIMAHEVLHGMLGHMGRTKLYLDRGFGPDMKPFNQSTMNDAEDYIINAMLKEAGVGTFPAGGLWSPDVTSNMLADEVYVTLNAIADPDAPPEQGNPGDRGADDLGNEGFDEHVPAPPGTEISEEELKTAIAQATQAADAMGKMPDSLKRMIGALLDPELSWEEQFRNSIMSKVGNDTSTWSRPNRRRIAVAPHVYYPGRTGFELGGIVLQIDISGSINYEALTKMFSEAYGLLSECRAEWVKVICVGAYVDDDQVWDIDDAEELLEFAGKIQGGGGTDMECSAQWLADNGIEPEQMVVFTDGITSFSKVNPWDCDVTWVLTKDAREPPYGTNVYMK